MSPRPKKAPTKNIPFYKNGPMSSRKFYAQRSANASHSPAIRTSSTTLQVRSQIPRALLLSPCTSTMTLPASSINYRVRKSSDASCPNEGNMVPISSLEGDMVVGKRHEDMIGTLVVPQNRLLMKRFLADSENYANSSIQAQKKKEAAEIIFGALLAKCLRKRMDEMRLLEQEFAELKLLNESKLNQLRDSNRTYILEQKRTLNLQRRLKQSEQELRSLKSTKQTLNISLIEAKTDKAALEQQIVMKNETIKTLINQGAQLKVVILGTNNKKRLEQLEEEKLESQMLQEEKEILVLEMQDLKEKIMCNNVQFVGAMIAAKNNAVNETRRRTSTLKMSLAENEDKKQQLKDSEFKMKQEILSLRAQTEAMKVYMEHSFGKRIKNSLRHNKTMLEWMYWILLFLMPGLKLAQANLLMAQLVRKALNFKKA